MFIAEQGIEIEKQSFLEPFIHFVLYPLQRPACSEMNGKLLQLAVKG